VTNILTVTIGTSECAGHDGDEKGIDPDTCYMHFGRYEDDVLEGVGVELGLLYMLQDSDGQQRSRSVLRWVVVEFLQTLQLRPWSIIHMQCLY